MDKKLKHTTSIGIAAAFLSKGAKLEKVDKTDPKHMIFSFSDGNPESVSEAVDVAISETNMESWERAWANETLEVNAVKFMNAIQRLKSIIHSI